MTTTEQNTDIIDVITGDYRVLQNPTEDCVVSSPYAPVLVLAVEPREELQIAKDTAQAI